MWLYWNVTLNATLTSNFACDINKTIPFINNVHVDAISYTGNGIGCGDHYFFLCYTVVIIMMMIHMYFSFVFIYLLHM